MTRENALILEAGATQPTTFILAATRAELK